MIRQQYPYLDFNSIKVRLELESTVQNHCVRIFQFHKGTIRTHKENTDMEIAIKFQFHKGTIRTSLNEKCSSHKKISIP